MRLRRESGRFPRSGLGMKLFFGRQNKRVAPIVAGLFTFNADRYVASCFGVRRHGHHVLAPKSGNYVHEEPGGPDRPPVEERAMTDDENLALRWRRGGHLWLRRGRRFGRRGGDGGLWIWRGHGRLCLSQSLDDVQGLEDSPLGLFDSFNQPPGGVSVGARTMTFSWTMRSIIATFVPTPSTFGNTMG